MTKNKSRNEELIPHSEGVKTDVFGTGDLSGDESSFYGDEQTRASFMKYATLYDPKTYWDVTQWNIQCIAARAVSRALEETKDPAHQSKSLVVPFQPSGAGISGENKELSTRDSARLYNPYEGDLMAKQLAESLPDFLARLKPSETSVGDGGPCIWVANPQSTYRPASEDIAGFKEAGSKALSDYWAQKRVYEQQHPNKTQGGITRMLRGDRVHLETEIIDLAKRHRVTCGKWMLFPTAEKVDAVWSTVAEATVNGQLGCAARVATDDGDPNNRVRLVYIYTSNFSDLQDVTRVLKQIERLDLLKGSKGDIASIFYKCEAYTHLDIHSNNEYKLKASMYNSKDLL